MNSKIEALKLAVSAVVQSRGLPSATEIELTENLTNFVVCSVDKFVKGQKEHGGDIRDRDLNREMMNEIIDLFHYLSFNQKR